MENAGYHIDYRYVALEMWPMISYKLVTTLVLLAVPTLRAWGQSGDLKTGTLTVYVISTTGGPLPTGRLSIDSVVGTTVYSGGIKGESTTRLHFGKYTVTFQAEFIKPVTREVSIDKEDTFLVLATTMDTFVLDVHFEPVSVSVRVRPASVCTPGSFLWAKLVGVFSDYVSERKISPGGYALFEPLEGGAYVVMVVDGREVRATQPVITKGEITTVDVPLAPCK